MSQLGSFFPSRKKGLLLNGAAIVFLLALSAATFFFGLQQQAGTYFVLLLLLALLSFAPLPLLVYQIYALLRARYTLERDGLHLRWGLRAEDIPLVDVEWVRPASELPYDLPRPRPNWPGMLLGTVQVEGLGPVEYLASATEDLLLVATPNRIYAISPEDQEGFFGAVQEAFEMGSLDPIPAHSVLPAAYLARIWNDRFARWMVSLGLALALVFFIWVSLAIPGRETASLGFYPEGAPLPPSPATQLLLVPFLGLAFYALDLAVGLILYRQTSNRPLAYLLWGSSIFTTLLLVGASVFLL